MFTDTAMNSKTSGNPPEYKKLLRLIASINSDNGALPVDDPDKIIGELLAAESMGENFEGRDLTTMKFPEYDDDFIPNPKVQYPVESKYDREQAKWDKKGNYEITDAEQSYYDKGGTFNSELINVGARHNYEGRTPQSRAGSESESQGSPESLAAIKSAIDSAGGVEYQDILGAEMLDKQLATQGVRSNVTGVLSAAQRNADMKGVMGNYLNALNTNKKTDYASALGVLVNAQKKAKAEAESRDRRYSEDSKAATSRATDRSKLEGKNMELRTGYGLDMDKKIMDIASSILNSPEASMEDAESARAILRDITKQIRDSKIMVESTGRR